jgi:hypothetical protein
VEKNVSIWNHNSKKRTKQPIDEDIPSGGDTTTASQQQCQENRKHLFTRCGKEANMGALLVNPAIPV